MLNTFKRNDTHQIFLTRVLHDHFKSEYVHLKKGGSFPVEKLGKSIIDSVNRERGYTG